jgi:hypothetical protein
MKSIAVRFLVASLTFTLSLVLAWLVSVTQDGKTVVEDTRIEISAVSPEPEEPRFRPIFTACGLGSVTTYKLPDGQELTTGSVCKDISNAYPTRMEYEKLLAKASRIVERIPHHKISIGRVGERTAALYTDEAGNQQARILWYDGGTTFLFIEAPSLELALEFERSDFYIF